MVYRIFTDLFDMRWWEKHTALYNLATHSIDKIVKAFEPVSEQVHKDELGKLKIQVVVDWSVTAGLSHGTEYQSFFNHLSPNGHFSGRTAPLTYRCCIFYLFNRYTY
jgi:hypothetical protein